MYEYPSLNQYIISIITIYFNEIAIDIHKNIYNDSTFKAHLATIGQSFTLFTAEFHECLTM